MFKPAGHVFEACGYLGTEEALGIRHVVVKSEGVGCVHGVPFIRGTRKDHCSRHEVSLGHRVGGHLGLVGRLLLSSLVCRLLFTLVIPIAEKEAA